MKMMKSVVVVVLLHLCLGNNLHTEILEDLSNLTQENFSFPKQYRGPSQEMREKPCECQLVFATELKLVVSKVNARTEEHKPLLNRLQKNIQALLQISAPEEAGICPMMNKTTKHSKKKTIIVLTGYKSFLKNMNEKDC